MNWNQFLPKEKVIRSLLPPSSRSLIALRWLMLITLGLRACRGIFGIYLREQFKWCRAGQARSVN